MGIGFVLGGALGAGPMERMLTAEAEAAVGEEAQEVAPALAA
jgi:hypothetical protein